MDKGFQLGESVFVDAFAATQAVSEPSRRFLRGAFGYCGSKQRLARKILSYLPPHHCWVELFGGALALTMAKASTDIEVVNDLDNEVINAFRQIRDNGDRLAEMIELTPYARAELFDARKVREGDSDLERARKFLVQAMMTVNGVLAGSRGGFSVSDTYAREGKEARVNRWHNYPERLRAVTQRLRNVRIENKDGVCLLEEYSNKPATLVYIDPPYLADRRPGYAVEANDQQFHAHLLSQALLCKCMIVLSSYESNTYTTLLENRGGWRRFELGAATQTTNGQKLRRTEMLWMNKPAERAWAANRVGISLTATERRDGRVNPPRGPKRKVKRIWRAS